MTGESRWSCYSTCASLEAVWPGSGVTPCCEAARSDTHTLHLQPSRYAVSKKRISPRLALLCHTTATSTQTGGKKKKNEFKKVKVLPLQVIESLQLKLTFGFVLSEHDLKVMKWSSRGCRMLTKKDSRKTVSSSICVYKEVKVNLHYRHSLQLIKKKKKKKKKKKCRKQGRYLCKEHRAGDTGCVWAGTVLDED